MPETSLLEKDSLYEIRVKGHLDKRRMQPFDYLTLTHHPNGETALAGPIPDQAALYGILNWLRDLGIPLVAVKPLKTEVD